MKINKYCLLLISFAFFSCSDETSNEPRKSEEDPVAVYMMLRDQLSEAKIFAGANDEEPPQDNKSQRSRLGQDDQSCESVIAELSSIEVDDCGKHEYSCSGGDLLSTTTYEIGCDFGAGKISSGSFSIIGFFPITSSYKVENKSSHIYNDIVIDGEKATGSLDHELHHTKLGFVSANKGELSIENFERTLLFSYSSVDTMKEGESCSWKSTVIESSKGYRLTSMTIAAIISKDNCMRSIDENTAEEIEIEGKESVTVETPSGDMHELIIDYGDGTCDQVYTVTDEQGKVREFNFEDDKEIF